MLGEGVCVHDSEIFSGMIWGKKDGKVQEYGRYFKYLAIQIIGLTEIICKEVVLIYIHWHY